MSTSIKHNLLAVETTRHLTAHYASLSDSVRRLSTGLRVERAADDAAGLAAKGTVMVSWGIAGYRKSV